MKGYIPAVFLILLIPFCAFSAERHKGMAYFLAFSDYNSAKVERDLGRIASLGCNWVSLDVALWQSRSDDPDIALPVARQYRHPVLKTVYRPDLWHHFPSDDEIGHFVETAHRLGLKVLFKPHIHPEHTGMRVIGPDGRGSDPMWPGRVHMRSEEDWEEWFRNYTAILSYYLKTFPFDAICIGDELSGTYGRSREWRRLISDLRSLSDIPITCAFNWWVVIHHQRRWLISLLRLLNLEDNVLSRMISKSGYRLEFDAGALRETARDAFGEYPDWTDALDWVGLNFYFPLSDERNPSLETLKRAWHRYEIPSLIGSVSLNYVEGMRSWRDKIGKPLLFTEGGWGKWDYAAKYPGDWYVRKTGNVELQARCYRAFFEEVYPLSMGAYFWDWAEPGFSPEGGPAEEIVREFFSSEGE
jgi:hypothetical protein